MNNSTPCFSVLNHLNSSFSICKIITFAASIIIAVLSPVAVVGNALVLAAIWRNASLRSTSYILLAGLAVTDFGTGLLSAPFHVAEELIPMAKSEYSVIKYIATGFTSFFFLTTTLIVTLMAIERWLHMTRRSLITARRASYIVAVMFILPIPYVVLHTQGERKHRVALDIASILLLLFSLCVTTLVYFKVFIIIRCHQQRVNHAGESSNNQPQPSINIAKYKKSVYSIIYILAVFYLGYAPMLITFGIYLGLPITYSDTRISALKAMVVFPFMSSSLNPILYLWRMKDIRDEVKRLVKRIPCKNN